MSTSLNESRLKRKERIRRKLSGSTERPRLTVYKSLKHMYAQVVDDVTGNTLTAASDLELKDLAGQKLKKVQVAAKVGELVAKKCKEKSIEAVVFDRNGFPYHGRISALADAARKAGLKF